MRSTTTRLTAGLGAAVTAIAMAAGPAAAAPAQGPDVFDSFASGTGLNIAVNLPPSLAEGLAPALDQLPGITLDGATLDISLAKTLSELELPLTETGPGDVSVAATASTVTGSIQGFVETITGQSVECLSTPVKVAIPEGAATPLLGFELLQAECTKDATGRLSIAASKIANLEVNLAGALEIVNTLPGGTDISGALEDTVDQVSEVVENEVFPVIGGVLEEVQNGVSETVGTEVDLTEALRVPEPFDVPLVKIKLLETVSTTQTEGDFVRAVTSTTLAGAQLIGTVCLPDVTYVAESSTNGKPGGATWNAEIPRISAGICDTELLATMLELREVDGVIGDILVNLGSGELKPLADVLTEANDQIPMEDIIAGLEDLMATLGVTAIVQGHVADSYAAEDGSKAGVTVNPFRIGVQPFGQLAAGTELEGVGVMITGLSEQTGVQAAGYNVTEPAPVNMPRTGGGTAAALLGVLAMGSAVALRKRF